ncbi:GTPase-activating protein [Elasticomyces elasticus]|uniref:GTPase-activating protein n=1 Tax=Exophiala sideris TaxID=1016849 RepID=A0ABR0JP74_9EURO|nr:GTPase-activating protein [Elasticomyces elasticus]KAK5038278.1 GTPase-activating protein [Exophiala sideris]KAK5044262.1 GTPase-activating protein [Exophiala sideris]KAK5067762.1 GTPase-activating protein [Exophiala sideris]KAK5183998.1 GTPase-activating protein [Eurotiomycetes sp. CCFEE 6388]
MAELFRDTVAGQFIRLITGRKILQYPEERDPSIWQKYLNVEKSANMAMHGSTDPPSAEEKERLDTNASPSEDDANLQSPDHNSHHQRRGSPAESSTTTTVDNDNRLVNTLSNTKVDVEKGRNADIVDWYGPEDPDNPQNWSTPKKVWVTFEVCLLTFSVYIGSAIYTAGIEDVSQVFGVSRVAATLGLTLFVLGYGVGPMLWSPMSEVPQFGRSPIYIGTLALFVVLQVPTALATNFGMLLAFRFITGFVGSPSLATGGATIADMYTPAKRTYGMAVWGIGAILGPTMGPLIGGFAAENKGWTWTIWELMWLSGFTLILLIFFLPETSSANILYRRTMRLRRLTGNDKLICEPQLIGEQMTGREIVMMVLVRPFTLCFTEPMVLLLNLYIALIYGLLYIWFESFPIVFINIYGFNLGTEGLAFLGILIGAFVVIGPFTWYQRKYIEPKFNEKGELQPEWRLPPSFVGGFCIPICLFWFGWSARPDVHWIMPIIGSSFFSIGAFLLFNSVLNYLTDAYPTYAASVLAGNDFLRSSWGAAFPLFATGMYNQLGVGWASSTLAFISIAFIPIPFLLFKYGEKLRMKSKYAQKDY